MAIKIQSPAQIAAKFARVTPGRTDDYALGIQSTSPDAYESATIASEPIYNQAITQSIARKAFAAGVRGSGQRWLRKALDLGTARFASGAAAAAQDYAEGFAPFQAVIAALTLPPRGPAGDPKNIERVRVIADALRKRKLAG